jgi:hypothetical protein
MLVGPLGSVAQVDVKPSSGGAFPIAPEGDLQVLPPIVATQHQPNVGEELALIESRRIEILE